ncbi:hypothetical protein PCANC_15122 [Puccinia coronata f. sp. avenae]|uniref:Uncharacterized protein n=1 Tax=Puccinia coronata f. sp. avenae TaxID=200324 RepID=A0A2N5SQY0_9BASI|nr:hypothetical protein PCANC_15122 [Puccinia coronata f. sp. avenae]
MRLVTQHNQFYFNSIGHIHYIQDTNVSYVGHPIPVDVTNIHTGHPLDATDTGHPLDVTDTSHPLDVTDTGHPLDVTDAGHPLDATNTSHPLDVTDTSHPLDVTDASHPLDVTNAGHPLDVTNTGHPLDVNDTGHPHDWEIWVLATRESAENLSPRFSEILGPRIPGLKNPESYGTGP